MSNIEEIYKILKLGIIDYFKKSNFSRAVIGLSGGIDSTVSAFLTAHAIGNENVDAILMPEIDLTSNQNMKDAESIARILGIRHYTIEINDFISNFQYINKKIKFKENIYAIANAKARIRMAILYYFANLCNSLVIGTSDKSEIALGYATKYGDSASDILVIGDLWKTDVLKLAKFLEVPESVISKKSTPELIAGQDAEKELGVDYNVVDQILKLYIEENLSIDDITKKGFEESIVKSIINRIRLNEHKRRSTFVIKINENTF